jgi:hypothetical protein
MTLLPPAPKMPPLPSKLSLGVIKDGQLIEHDLRIPVVTLKILATIAG